MEFYILPNPNPYLKRMCIDELCRHFDLIASLLGFCSSEEEFALGKELYLRAHAELTERMKHAPLEFLTMLADKKHDFDKDEDPDNRSETSDRLDDIAKREIHRRSFLNVTLNPGKKIGINSQNLGFPRKPKK